MDLSNIVHVSGIISIHEKVKKLDKLTININLHYHAVVKKTENGTDGQLWVTSRVVASYCTSILSC